MFRFLLKKLAWNWCFSWPLLNKQDLIQMLVICKLQGLLLQSFICLDIVVLLYMYSGDLLESYCLLMPNSNAKFVTFGLLSKHEITICVSFIKRTDRFCSVDIHVLSFSVTDQAWHSLSNKTILNQSKFSWMH